MYKVRDFPDSTEVPQNNSKCLEFWNPCQTCKKHPDQETTLCESCHFWICKKCSPKCKFRDTLLRPSGGFVGTLIDIQSFIKNGYDEAFYDSEAKKLTIDREDAKLANIMFRVKSYLHIFYQDLYEFWRGQAQNHYEEIYENTMQKSNTAEEKKKIKEDYKKIKYRIKAELENNFFLTGDFDKTEDGKTIFTSNRILNNTEQLYPKLTLESVNFKDIKTQEQFANKLRNSIAHCQCQLLEIEKSPPSKLNIHDDFTLRLYNLNEQNEKDFETEVKMLEIVRFVRNAFYEISKFFEEIQKSFTPAKLLHEATKGKEWGNNFFKRGEFKAATNQYSKVITLLERAITAENFLSTKEDKFKANEIKVICALNIANCKRKLKEYNEAINISDWVIRQDKTKGKAYYHRGSAYESLGSSAFDSLDTKIDNFKKALENYSDAEKLIPKDLDIKKAIKKVEAKLKKAEAKSKRS